METEIHIKVTPNSSKTACIGIDDFVFKIRLKATAKNNEANNELIRFISKKLNINKSSVQIISGAKSRHKKIRIEGVDLETCIHKLYTFL